MPKDFIPFFEKSVALERYLKEIGKYELLTPQEEIELARRAKQGDQEAIHRLIVSNLRFVVSVAKQYQGLGLSIEDLIAEGNMGLLKAIEKFDESRGFKFISYAVWWIRQSILQALIEQTRPFRIPASRVGNTNRVKRKREELLKKYEREPSLHELAEELNLSPLEVERAQLDYGFGTSIDNNIAPDSDSKILDFIADDSFAPPDYHLHLESIRKGIMTVLNTLEPREQEVIKLNFGIGYERPLSLGEICVRLGLTRERVRQIRESALRKLRQEKRIKLLRNYI